MLECAKNELVGAIFTPSHSAKNELYSIYSHAYPRKSGPHKHIKRQSRPIRANKIKGGYHE